MKGLTDKTVAFIVYFQKSKGKTSEPATKRPKFADGEDDVSWELENNRHVKVREFRGKVLVDIREYYEKDGKLLPGKKGISLSGPQFKKLCEIFDDVKAEVNKH
jgi:Transcriptional Coactivator p15 (PC4)